MQSNSLSHWATNSLGYNARVICYITLLDYEHKTEEDSTKEWAKRFSNEYSFIWAHQFYAAFLWVMFCANARQDFKFRAKRSFFPVKGFFSFEPQHIHEGLSLFNMKGSTLPFDKLKNLRKLIFLGWIYWKKYFFPPTRTKWWVFTQDDIFAKKTIDGNFFAINAVLLIFIK